MAILEGVRPLRMIPPSEMASNSNNAADCDPSNVASFPGNSTSWLPPGWTVFDRIKSNGASYKVYRESDTGRKFYSRPEVLNYLQNPTPHAPYKRTPHMIPRTETASNNNDMSDCDPSKVASSVRNSTSWLPPGWTVFNRIKSSGASYKVYRESDTGRKFYSRPEVLKYLQIPTPRTPYKITLAEMSPGKHPNWLPPDWVVEIKTKMSGRTAGNRYKVYIEKSTGRKFYSQREALDYLKPSNASTPEIINVQIVRSEDHPHWLPSGWSVQTEIEGGSSMAEKKDKVYVEPITEMKFYPHKEVFEHLNNLSSSSTENKKNAELESNSGDQTDQIRDTEIEETNVEGLPPGWFKAIRYRESRAGIRRKVALYVDPKSGYAFFSTKDALRYVDNGHIKNCRMKPTLWKEISEDITENKFHLFPTGEKNELKSEERKGKRPLFTEENYERKSEDCVVIDDSDEENEYKLENKEKRPLISEESGKKQSEDITETADSPIGAEKAGTAGTEEEKMPEASPVKKTRFKVLASKRRPLIGSSSSTSAKPLTSNPSSV